MVSIFTPVPTPVAVRKHTASQPMVPIGGQSSFVPGVGGAPLAISGAGAAPLAISGAGAAPLAISGAGAAPLAISEQADEDLAHAPDSAHDWDAGGQDPSLPPIDIAEVDALVASGLSEEHQWLVSNGVPRNQVRRFERIQAKDGAKDSVRCKSCDVVLGKE